MKKIRLRTVFIFAMAIASGALLLHTSQNVQDEQARLTEISQIVEHEKESIRVLKTEWAYLNNPERLEALATQYLGLKASNPEQITTDGTKIPVKLQMPTESVTAAPIMEAQPVSYTPPAKAAPAIPSPQEKSLDTLIHQVTGEGVE